MASLNLLLMADNQKLPIDKVKPGLFNAIKSDADTCHASAAIKALSRIIPKLTEDEIFQILDESKSILSKPGSLKQNMFGHFSFVAALNLMPANSVKNMVLNQYQFVFECLI